MKKINRNNNNDLFCLFKDRCDAQVDCYRIRNDIVEFDTGYTLKVSSDWSITDYSDWLIPKDEVFTKCTTFNIHLEASAAQNLRLRDLRSEMSIANKVKRSLTKKNNAKFIFSNRLRSVG